MTEPLHDVALNLGSNLEPEVNLRLGIEKLRALFGALELSPVYRSPAVGFDGPPFLNLAVRLQTLLSLEELAQTLRDIELSGGRPADAQKFSSRTLDIDIVLFDDLVGVCSSASRQILLPRPDLCDYPHMLKPMADLMPQACHPTVGQSYEQLWEEMHKGLGANAQLCEVVLEGLT
ncbi:2-amino-4-hydroxy-6-hydroxymethyldihydropteridine diphosphokinase [Pokkaliibacter sp. CJK22405]|uniref:2-amino-4-hydroxy-6- hydroxymethyldihydropteridine diphosphokinase n=1 Tax=Pokkaliibacter sp. CJK22405 TaxID=3384615 RepID=UPI0039848E8C